MKAKAATALFLVCVALFLTAAGTVDAARFSQTVSAAEFERMTDEKMEALLRDKGETRRHEVALVKPPRDMKLPAGEVSFSVEAPLGLLYDRRTPIYVSVLLDGRPYRRALSYYTVRVYDTVLVASRNLFPEQTLSEADMRFEEREVTRVRGRCLKDKGEAFGRVVSRMVREGTILSEDLLRQPVVMESGAVVTIVSHYNGIEVRVSGIALTRGRVGQKIRVRNAASRKVMLARVLDASTVEIGS